MKLSINKMCRGQGTAYLLAAVSHEVETNIRFSAQSEKGRVLPLEAYHLDDKKDFVYFVLATPLLDTKDIFIKAEEIGLDGELLGIQTRHFSRSRIKWSSRLYYKIDSKQAYRLRDIDRFTYSSQIHIKPMYYSMAKSKHKILVKGIICCPQHETSPSLRLLESDGKEISSFEPFFQKPQAVLYDGVPRIEIGFTARVPDDKKTYCLVASGSEKCRAGFMCFDAPSRDYYRYLHTPSYFRFADFERWDPFAKDRIRKFELASPSDYIVDDGPLFSIVVPLYNTPIAFFKEMVNSVLGQLYQRWELILVNSTPENAKLSAALEQVYDERIHIVGLSKNLGISGNTNAGIEHASGDYIVFFDHDDVLDKLVLFRYAEKIMENPETDVLYCDEDFLTEDGHYINPHFKSDFNIDLLRCHNYITHLLAVRASYVQRLRLRSEFDGAQDYDFLLRLVEITQNIAHIPEVLYHWRMSDTSTAKSSGNKSYAEEAGLRALESHLVRCKLHASAGTSNFSCFYNTRYQVEGSPLVSIVIPNKDSVEVLSRCLKSIDEKTEYRKFEVIIVENNSELDETFEFYRLIEKQYAWIRVVYWPREFNYSKINNFGVHDARGEYLLLLNNDTEVISTSWLDSMLGFCQRDEVGVVGARLLYPDDTVQHAGVAMIYCNDFGEMGGPVHVFGHLDDEDPGYMNRSLFSQDVLIVTGACLMTKKSVYESVGGLTEKYAVAYNDVDYCLKVRREGHLVVYDADALLYHYESFSRGSDKVKERANRFISEQGMLRSDWPECFSESDPYYGRYVLS